MSRLPKNPPIPKSRWVSGSAVAFAVVMFACGGTSAVEPLEDAVLKVEVGQPVPDIVLPSLEDGSPASLAQFRGEKVLLHVFASW